MPQTGKTDPWTTFLGNSPLPSRLFLREIQLNCWDSHCVGEGFFGLGVETGFAFSFTEFSSAYCSSRTVLSALYDPSAFNPHSEVDNLDILIFQLGKLRLRDVNQHAQGPTAKLQWNRNLDLGPLIPWHTVFTSRLYFK